ncbi:MAG: DMT family transporter [Polynucleobacter sp.]|nr:DMT family transporter [Polynucleobacter sp.]
MRKTLSSLKANQTNQWFIAISGAIFILLWSTGFIVARYGMPYSEPFTFLVLRFGGVLLCMLPFVYFLRIPIPPKKQILHIAVSGLLLQLLYIGGVWSAIKLGMPAGVTALLVGLQPVITACLASIVAERVNLKQWLGLILGFLGVGLVLFTKIKLDGLLIESVLLSILGLLAITAGTFYQKRFCPHFDLRIGSVIQFAASFLGACLLAFLFESRHVEWNAPMMGALLWSIVILSIGANSLMFLLIRHGEVTKVTSLIYLSPPLTALLAWLLFNETLSAYFLLGLILTTAGVLLVNQKTNSENKVATP